MNNAPLTERVTLTLDKLPAVICENCQGEIFTDGVMLRELSPLITGERDTKLAPIPVFICANCKEVHQKYLPEGLRKKKLVV
jgi:hypothetical protein